MHGDRRLKGLFLGCQEDNGQLRAGVQVESDRIWRFGTLDAAGRLGKDTDVLEDHGETSCIIRRADWTNLAKYSTQC